MAQRAFPPFSTGIDFSLRRLRRENPVEATKGFPGPKKGPMSMDLITILYSLQTQSWRQCPGWRNYGLSCFGLY